MHKRKLELYRLVPLVLLTTILFPTIARAAGPAGAFGKEQPPAFDRLDNPPFSSDTRGFGYLYTIVAGDDLWLVATAHGISMEALAEANGLEAPYWIYPDDQIWIPAAPAEVKRAPAPTPPPAPTPLPTPAPTPAPSPDQPVVAAPETPADQPPQPEPAPAVQPATQAITTTAAATLSVAPPAPAISGDALLIFNLINEKRMAGGRPALTWSDPLARAAQSHAEDCAPPRARFTCGTGKVRVAPTTRTSWAGTTRRPASASPAATGATTTSSTSANPDLLWPVFAMHPVAGRPSQSTTTNLTKGNEAGSPQAASLVAVPDCGSRRQTKPRASVRTTQSMPATATSEPFSPAQIGQSPGAAWCSRPSNGRRSPSGKTMCAARATSG